MSDRDDMVIRPSMGEHQPTAEVRARAERRLARYTDKHVGLFTRAAQAATRKALRRGAALAQGGARRVIESGGRAPALAAANRAGGLALGTVATLLLAASIATVRIASGQPLEGVGEKVNSMLLGDLDDKARAALTTRRQLESNQDIVRLVGRQGKITAQVAAIADGLYAMHEREEIGAAMLRKRYPVNNWLDMLILRARDKLVATWNGLGGPTKLEQIARKLEEAQRSKKAR